MSSFVVTRGLGGNSTNMIARGFVPLVRAIGKGGRRFIKKSLVHLEESFKISAMLVSANGKELVKPIISNVAKIFKNDNEHTIKVKPQKLIARRAESIKVTASFKKVEKT